MKDQRECVSLCDLGSSSSCYRWHGHEPERPKYPLVLGELNPDCGFAAWTHPQHILELLNSPCYAGRWFPFTKIHCYSIELSLQGSKSLTWRVEFEDFMIFFCLGDSCLASPSAWSHMGEVMIFVTLVCCHWVELTVWRGPVQDLCIL